MTRAGKVVLLVQLLLLTWRAVKRAGSRTAPDLKGGSEADLAEGRKHGHVSWLGGGKSEEGAQSTNKSNGSLEAALALAQQGRATGRGMARFPRLRRMWATGSAQGDDVNGCRFFFCPKFACYSKLGMLPFAIVKTLF